MNKPIRRAALHEAVQRALSSSPAEGPDRDGDAISPEEERRPARVLLVEDNAVNRHVAQRMLESRHHEVVTAEDGAAALERLARDPAFDVILMDVQMPGMDGFETTRRIRQDAKLDGVAIIAMTAHALKGDRERCLAAGMDDYLSKPLRSDSLLAKIDQWVREPRQRPSSDESEVEREAPAPRSPVVLDMETALERMLGDRELFAEAVAMLREDIPARLEAIGRFVEAGDLEAVRAEAHAVKGSVANLGAEAMREAAQALELSAAEGSADDVAAAHRALDEAWFPLLDALNEAVP